MKGVQFVVDDEGKQQAVLIDLKKNRQLWEDFFDAAVAESRADEPRESLSDVKRRILGEEP
jgi:hypothetical protein